MPAYQRINPRKNLIDLSESYDTKNTSPSSHKPDLQSPYQRRMKWLSLLLLIGQNAALALLTRWARTRSGGQFVSTTAVVMSEFFKLCACLFLVLGENHYSFTKWISELYEILVINWVDTLKVAVPAFVYMIQNNLLYVAITNLPAATFQVT